MALLPEAPFFVSNLPWSPTSSSPMSFGTIGTLSIGADEQDCSSSLALGPSPCALWPHAIDEDLAQLVLYGTSNH